LADALSRSPGARFVFSHPAHVVAFGFGSGLAPIGPGTAGTLLAFPLHALLDHWLTEPQLLLAITLLFSLGVWACGRTGDTLGVSDHGGMNWDEVVAFMLVLVFTPAGFGWQVFAFCAFRFFDIVKPPPIRRVDRNVKGGFGAMLDDVLAACYTVLLVAVVARVVG